MIKYVHIQRICILPKGLHHVSSELPPPKKKKEEKNDDEVFGNTAPFLRSLNQTTGSRKLRRYLAVRLYLTRSEHYKSATTPEKRP